MRTPLALGLVVLVALLVPSCGGPPPQTLHLAPEGAVAGERDARGSGDSTALKVFVHEKGFPPFDFGSGDSAPGVPGLYLEVFAELCRRAGLEWTAVVLPPARIYQAFATGDVDVEIGVNPQWRQSDADLSVYTESFAIDENLLLVRPGFSRVPVRSLGTVLGYVYPSHEKAFQSNQVTRLDVNNEADLFEVLRTGRVEGILVTKAVGLYYMKKSGYQAQVAGHFDQLPLAIRVRRAKADVVPGLNRALEAMKADGTLAALYHRYE